MRPKQMVTEMEGISNVDGDTTVVSCLGNDGQYDMYYDIRSPTASE